MGRTLEELIQQEKPEVVDAAKVKAKEILEEIETSKPSISSCKLDSSSDNQSTESD
ncbi:hypothetical protein ACNKV7_002448 [Vibrio cholerae]|uniref:hypothetical protein n=1 Tax=Gammaproteobacteria TaxID=1236 RepID=UPI00030A2363|nr:MULTISPECIES: hypothetical protein [Gammaproteobacteria]EJL6324877.1 hypothetical protein [Vibrio cholerae]EJL6768880.1 hypothetical protein [Vibrio cholerae]ELH4196984.1 hypothetical protein [Vibrio cholerae]MDH1626883.1 hypothetical protein [Shewanella xiamenensis]MDT3744646.1 hypothetical protein [Vibrio cholerae]